MRRRLIVMVKEPRPGRVKTRLAKDIGYIDAAWWFRHQTRRLIRRLRDPRWTLTLAVAPDRDGVLSKVWPGDIPRLPQGRGDLGDRMARLLRSQPPGPVIIIGSDVPGVTKTHIANAFSMLSAHEAIFGPAPDGGYWLVGLKRARAVSPYLFEQVRWSSKHALKDSQASLPGHRIALTLALQDVDTVADLTMTRAQTRGNAGL